MSAAEICSKLMRDLMLVWRVGREGVGGRTNQVLDVTVL